MTRALRFSPDPRTRLLPSRPVAPDLARPRLMRFSMSGTVPPRRRTRPRPSTHPRHARQQPRTRPACRAHLRRPQTVPPRQRSPPESAPTLPTPIVPTLPSMTAQRAQAEPKRTTSSPASPRRVELQPPHENDSVMLANDHPLEPRHHDHALSGEWNDHRDCHVKPASETRRPDVSAWLSRTGVGSKALIRQVVLEAVDLVAE